MLLKMLLFAMWCHLAPNPLYPGEALEVPLSYSMAAYVQAERHDNVSPAEVVAWLLGEHGSRGRRAKSTSVGDDGRSVGLYQIGHEELAEYNETHGTTYAHTCAEGDDTCRDLLDWMVSTRVSAWLVHRHKRQHRTKGYCLKCTPSLAKRDYCRVLSVEQADGSLGVEYVTPTHSWMSHVRCGPKQREFSRGCDGRRLRWILILERWQDTPAHSLLQSQ